jgi:hypothetical protein
MVAVDNSVTQCDMHLCLIPPVPGTTPNVISKRRMSINTAPFHVFSHNVVQSPSEPLELLFFVIFEDHTF